MKRSRQIRNNPWKLYQTNVAGGQALYCLHVYTCAYSTSGHTCAAVYPTLVQSSTVAIDLHVHDSMYSCSNDLSLFKCRKYYQQLITSSKDCMILILWHSLPLKYVHVPCATVSITMCVVGQVLNVRDNALKDSGVPSSMFHLQELVTLVSCVHTRVTLTVSLRYALYCTCRLHLFTCRFAETSRGSFRGQRVTPPLDLILPPLTSLQYPPFFLFWFIPPLCEFLNEGLTSYQVLISPVHVHVHVLVHVCGYNSQSTSI